MFLFLSKAEGDPPVEIFSSIFFYLLYLQWGPNLLFSYSSDHKLKDMDMFLNHTLKVRFSTAS